MIQIYRQTKTYTALKKDMYYNLSNLYEGVSYTVTPSEKGGVRVTLNGTCTVETGYRATVRVNVFLNAASYGRQFKLKSDLESRRSSVMLCMSYKSEGSTKTLYFEDGETEKDFTVPPDATDIGFIFSIHSGAELDVSFCMEIYTANTIAESEEDFERNGDMTLLPTTCTVHTVLNGAWELELTHPIDDLGRWKYIENGAVIKTPPFAREQKKDQLFRIKESKKIDSGIAVTAEPIFLDAMDDCFLIDTRPTQCTGQEALQAMTAGSKYTGYSDINRISTAYYQDKNLIEAINSDEDNSFVNRWGGEIVYDNLSVHINDRIGDDYGVQVLYGKNIQKDGVQEEVDDRDVVTRIVPKAYNGYGLDLQDEPWVDSPIIGAYPVIHTRVIKYEDVKLIDDASEDDEENGVIVCKDRIELYNALTAKCIEEFENGIDKQKVTLTVDMVLLQNTKEYEKYKILETVALGDTVHCRHYRLGIISDARVIELTYDFLTERVTDVVLGDFEYNYFNNVSSIVSRVENAIRSDGSVMADRIVGVLNAINTQLKYQKSIAQKQDVRAILFEDIEPNSPTYGAMCLGTQGFQIANSKNANGDWDWKTAFTAKGGYADTMILGVLSDQSGESYWDLVRGIMQLRGTFRAYRKDGSYTEMSADGLLNVSGSTKEEYLFMTYAGTTTITNFDNNSFEGTATITLPTKFKGKKITFVPFVQGIVLKGDRLSDPYYGALSKMAMRHTVNSANNTVTLTVECRAFYLQHETADGIIYPNEYGTPTSVTVAYNVIA